MSVYVDFHEQIKNMKPVASDPHALTKPGGFPFVKDAAARDRAYSLMQQAEEKVSEKGYVDDEVDALMKEALENEISAVEFTGNDAEDFMQVQDTMYLFGHRIEGEEQKPFERMSEQRLLDMLEEMMQEADREARGASDAGHAADRGFTSQDGTYKTQEGEKARARATRISENGHKIRVMMNCIENVQDLHERLQAD